MPVPGTDGEVGLSRIGERTRPRVLVLASSPKHASREKFAIAGAQSPAREARALPQNSQLRSPQRAAQPFN